MEEKFLDEAKTMAYKIGDLHNKDDNNLEKLSHTYYTTDKKSIVKIYRAKESNEDRGKRNRILKELMDNFKPVEKWLSNKRIEDYNLMYLKAFLYDPDIDTYYIVYEKKDGSLLDLLKDRIKFDEDEIRSLVKDLLNALCYLYREEKEECIMHTFISPEHILYVNTKEGRKYFLGGLEYCMLATTSFCKENRKLREYLKFYQKYHPCDFKYLIEEETDRIYPLVIGMICHALYTSVIPSRYEPLLPYKTEEYMEASGLFKSFMQYCINSTLEIENHIWRLIDLLESDFIKNNKTAIPKYLAIPKHYFDIEIIETEFLRLHLCKDIRNDQIYIRKEVYLSEERPEYGRSAKREAEILNEAKAKNNGYVLELIDAFIVRDDRLNMILEYFNGGSLRTFMKEIKGYKEGSEIEEEKQEGRAFYFAEVTLVAWNVAKALEALHEDNIWHRNITPNSILVKKNKELYVYDVKLANFDASKKIIEISPKHTFIGTPCYMAPEVSTCKYDGKIDVWGLGLVLLYIFTKENIKNVLRTDNKEEGILKIIEELKEDNSLVQDFKERPEDKTNKEVKKMYLDLIENCIRVNPEERYDIHKALKDIEAIIDKLDIEQHKYNLNEPSNEHKKIIKNTEEAIRGIKALRFAGVSPYIVEIYYVKKKGENLIIYHEQCEKEYKLENMKEYLMPKEKLLVLFDIAKGIKHLHGREIVCRVLDPTLIYAKKEIEEEETKEAKEREAVINTKISINFEALKPSYRVSDNSKINEGNSFFAPEVKGPIKNSTYYDNKQMEEDNVTKEDIEKFKKADIWSFGKIAEFVFDLDKNCMPSYNLSL